VKLADCVAQCRTPLVVQGRIDHGPTVLSDAADCAEAVARCPLRYVLSDDLTRLCADLAYSRGAGTVACADLLHIPAETLWVEWCNEPWKSALAHYEIPLGGEGQWAGRRGALIRSLSDGRRGLVRTFWNVNNGSGVRASSIEAYVDFDTAQDEEPEALDRESGRAGKVYDSARSADDLLGRCCRFRYERTWSDYYRHANLSAAEDQAIWRHSLGTIATDIPMLVAFLLLLATRSGLPQRSQQLERLNRQRLKAGKAPLLEHIEVRAPLLPEYRDNSRAEPQATRRSPRMHHVRGHLVRRGSQLFWRVPHLRGSARSGMVHTRTVVWTFDKAAH
jgi:hypothetical protein